LSFGQADVGVDVFRADPSDPNVRFALAEPEQAARQVVRVAASSTRWDRDFVSYVQSLATVSRPVDPLPFDGIDQIKVTFSEDVMDALPDFRLAGEDASRYLIRNFIYDVDTTTAVWTLESPLRADELTLRLTGVVDLDGNRLDGDGNGRPGGPFSYQISSLPGDVNRDGRVDRADVLLATVQSTVSVGRPNYVLAHDVDGSGVIDDSDRAVVQNLVGSALPNSNAGLRPGDADGDDIFGQLDIVRVLQSAKYMTGNAATWSDGDWNGDGVFNQRDLVLALQAGYTHGRPHVENGAVDDVWAAIGNP
jgi:hypothetical protein